MELFGVGPFELVLVMVVALLVIGPERLPEVARQIGKMVGDLRRMSAEFQEEMKQFTDVIQEPMRDVEETMRDAQDSVRTTVYEVPPAAEAAAAEQPQDQSTAGAPETAEKTYPDWLPSEQASAVASSDSAPTVDPTAASGPTAPPVEESPYRVAAEDTPAGDVAPPGPATPPEAASDVLASYAEGPAVNGHRPGEAPSLVEQSTADQTAAPPARSKRRGAPRPKPIAAEPAEQAIVADAASAGAPETGARASGDDAPARRRAPRPRPKAADTAAPADDQVTVAPRPTRSRSRPKPVEQPASSNEPSDDADLG